MSPDHRQGPALVRSQYDTRQPPTAVRNRSLGFPRLSARSPVVTHLGRTITVARRCQGLPRGGPGGPGRAVDRLDQRLGNSLGPSCRKAHCSNRVRSCTRRLMMHRHMPVLVHSPYQVNKVQRSDGCPSRASIGKSPPSDNTPPPGCIPAEADRMRGCRQQLDRRSKSRSTSLCWHPDKKDHLAHPSREDGTYHRSRTASSHSYQRWTPRATWQCKGRQDRPAP